MLEAFGTPMQNRFMMMAKLHLRMFLRDVHAFFRARKACREHVLSKATVRHEPERLINSSPWGKNLFPQKMIDEVKGSLVKDNTTLAARWKIPSQAPPKTSGQGSGHQQQQIVNPIPLKEVLSTLLREGEGRTLQLLLVQLHLLSRLILPLLIPICLGCFGRS